MPPGWVTPWFSIGLLTLIRPPRSTEGGSKRTEEAPALTATTSSEGCSLTTYFPFSERIQPVIFLSLLFNELASEAGCESCCMECDELSGDDWAEALIAEIWIIDAAAKTVHHARNANRSFISYLEDSEYRGRLLTLQDGQGDVVNRDPSGSLAVG